MSHRVIRLNQDIHTRINYGMPPSPPPPTQRTIQLTIQRIMKFEDNTFIIAIIVKVLPLDQNITKIILS